MTSKTKKEAKKSPSKPSKGKVEKIRESVASVGHNGKVNKVLQKIFSDYAALDEDGKAIAKAKRDLRARAKEEHGILSGVFNHEIKLQKMDSDTRVMFEQGHHDLKDMLGYQMSLQLNAPSGDDERDPEDAAREAAAG